MSSARVTVLDGGLMTTIQDRGRHGFRHLGIPVSGAADGLSLNWANLLVGNPPYAPQLECTQKGGTFRFETNAVIALTGADMQASLDGEPVDRYTRIEVAAGSKFSLGWSINGIRGYLSVAGALQLEPVMGSYSTLVQAGLGGFQGRALQEGDELIWEGPPTHEISKVPDGWDPNWRGTITLRAIPGPEWNRLPSMCHEYLTVCSFTPDPQSNRIGIRLTGQLAPTPHEMGQLRSMATLPGTVQLLPNGEPVILMPDGPTTGGYPRALQVIAADLHLLGQIGPRTMIAFELSNREAALQALRDSASGWTRLLE